MDGKEICSVSFIGALTNVKRNENEAIDDFDKRFDKVVQDILQTYKPTVDTILMYYMNAFQGTFNFFIHNANPTVLAVAKVSAKTLDEN